MGALAFPFKVDDRGHVSFVNDEARRIANEIINCVTTMKRERPMRPNFGGGAPGFVFHARDDDLVEVMRTQFRNSLDTYVPDANIERVNVDIDDADSSRIDVEILFSLQSEIDGEVYEAQVTLDGIVSEGTIDG